ncbi:MAG: phosphotransferase [Woeseia sp.]
MDVAVPRLLASDGRRLLVQEEIAGERLAQALHGADEASHERLLDNALRGLAAAQQAGSQAGFDTRLKALGDSREWLVGLLDRPAVIGGILDVPAPRPELPQLEALLALRSPRFIKWDARPGNAISRDDGSVYWFDWEHCGVRNRLDDLAWLLGDEHVPDYPAIEKKLLDKYLASFADDLSIDDARLYVSAYGVFHMAVRLGLIFRYKVKGDWWDHDDCVNRDKVGVTVECLRRMCTRGARWARANPYTEKLAPWFGEVFKRYGSAAAPV